MLRVFVAEDNASDSFWLEMVLKNAGLEYTLSVASDGEQARDALLQCASDSIPNLVLLDLNMPRLSGIEILKQLPEEVKRFTYILTGTEADVHSVEEELGIPSRNYILKPFTHEKLFDCLRLQASST